MYTKLWCYVVQNSKIGWIPLSNIKLTETNWLHVGFKTAEEAEKILDKINKKKKILLSETFSLPKKSNVTIG